MAVEYFLLPRKTLSQHHQRAKIHSYKHPTIAGREGAQTESKGIEATAKAIFTVAVHIFHLCFVHSTWQPDAQAFAAPSNADQQSSEVVSNAFVSGASQQEL